MRKNWLLKNGWIIFSIIACMSAVFYINYQEGLKEDSSSFKVKEVLLAATPKNGITTKQWGNGPSEGCLERASVSSNLEGVHICYCDTWNGCGGCSTSSSDGLLSDKDKCTNEQSISLYGECIAIKGCHNCASDAEEKECKEDPSYYNNYTTCKYEIDQCDYCRDGAAKTDCLAAPRPTWDPTLPESGSLLSFGSGSGKGFNLSNLKLTFNSSNSLSSISIPSYIGLNLKSNGGNGEKITEVCDPYAVGSCTIELKPPTYGKSNEVFIGWSTESSCKDENIIKNSNNSINISISDETTLYACWKNTMSIPTPVSQDSFVTCLFNGSSSVDNCPGKVMYAKDEALSSGVASIPCNTQVTVTTCEESLGDLSTTIYYSLGVLLKEDPKCNVSHINGKVVSGVQVHRNALSETSVTNCPEDNNPPVATTCATEQLSGKTNLQSEAIRVCYTYQNGAYVPNAGITTNNICATNYKPEIFMTEDTCTSKSDCYKHFEYRCVPKSKPTVSGSGSLVGLDGKGTITFKGGTGSSGIALKDYYISDCQSKPDNGSIWYGCENSECSKTLTVNQGQYCIWVRNEENIQSYSLMVKVHSSDVSTTLSMVQFTDADGNTSYVPRPVAFGDNGFAEGVTSSTYALLSNNFINNSKLATGFDQFTTTYELTAESPQIAVYATLTDKDASYVYGYEPRTVNLEYGRNIILIKIRNKNSDTRTYTFIITRPDDRESVNTLSSLKISKGKINFDPYISDYTISVPKNTKSVNINGTLMSDKAFFIEGYEPRKVTLNNDITSAVVKVISEAGIIRNYILTFIKTGEVIEETPDNSTYLSSLTVPGTELNFDKETNSYTVAVEYNITELPIYALAESDKASVTITGNTGFKVGTNLVQILVTNGNKSKVYNIYINRKEDSLGVSDSTKLKTFTVKGYDINFSPDVLDYELKIKREKTLLLSATPESNRSEVYMFGNNDLTTFSTIRVKVIAENGDTGIYSLSITKDVYNKTLELAAAVGGTIVVIGAIVFLIIKRKRKKAKEYVEE